MHECSWKKNGRQANGSQRYKCTICGQTKGDPVVRQIKQDKKTNILAMISCGKSIREIAKSVGVNEATVRRLKPKQIVPRPPVRLVGPDRCDWCGSKIHNHKEFHRRTARTKHKYCNQACYVSHRNSDSADDTCTLCGGKRGLRQCWNTGKGMCAQCYAIASRYGFDMEVARAAKLQRQLKKEILNVERNI